MKAIILLIALLAIVLAGNQPKPTPWAPPRPGQPSAWPAQPSVPQPGFPGHKGPWSNSMPTRFNARAAFQAFTHKLGLTFEQQEALQTCTMEVTQLVAPLVKSHALKQHALKFLLASDAEHKEFITHLLQKVQTSLPACSKFAMEVASIFSKVTLSEDEKMIPQARQHLTKWRLQKYSAEIVALLVEVVEDKHTGKSRQVGEKLATIVQMITGIAHPESIVDYMMTYEKKHAGHVEISVIETDRFLQQTLNVAAKQLGSTKQVSEQRVKELREASTGLIHYIAQAKMRLHSAHGLERSVAALAGLRDVVKAGAVVAENLKLTLEVLCHNHQHRITAAHVLRNYLKRGPALQFRSVDLAMEIKHHHPASAGKALAAVIETLFH